MRRLLTCCQAGRRSWPPAIRWKATTLGLKKRTRKERKGDP
jgi:hypothetical protein